MHLLCWYNPVSPWPRSEIGFTGRNRTLKGEFFWWCGRFSSSLATIPGLWNIILLGGFADCLAGEATRFHDSLIWSKQELRRNKEWGDWATNTSFPILASLHPTWKHPQLSEVPWSRLLNPNSALCFKPPVSGFLPEPVHPILPHGPASSHQPLTWTICPTSALALPRHPKVLSTPPPRPQEMWCLDPDAQTSYPSWPLICPKRSRTVWFYYIFWGSQGYLFNSHLFVAFPPFLSHPWALRAWGWHCLKAVLSPSP